MLEQMRTTLESNLNRVENLVVTYEGHPDVQGQGRKPAHVLDTLRAAVVFLHASLEDVLRTVAEWKLPNADQEVLDKVPLIGKGQRPSRFLLGALAQHRGKTVNDLIRESVKASLDQSNYNDTKEIAVLLTAVGLDVPRLNSNFTQLQEMMKRRHQIVHRADRQDQVTGSGNHENSPH